MRVMFFIDGFNVYHSLKKKYQRYLWLNYLDFVSCYTTSKQTISGVYYFTALAYWLPDSRRRHKDFIEAVENTGVTVIYGQFKEKDRYCTKCNRWFKGHEEKNTDVNIAVHLYHNAHMDNYDKAVIVTNDTDLVSAIQLVKATFPQKEMGILFPIHRRSTELKKVSDFTLRTTEKQLASSQFPGKITLPNGRALVRPAKWI